MTKPDRVKTERVQGQIETVEMGKGEKKRKKRKKKDKNDKKVWTRLRTLRDPGSF